MRRASLEQPLRDKILRDHLLEMLKGGSAHADFDAAMGDWPVQLAGVKVANFPHTAWMLLEHMRLAQWDILEFSRNPKHVSPEFPAGYWPETDAPPDDKSWQKSIRKFRAD
ncbi:MAG: DinB family protein, partial [Terriglobales bacterium]